MQIPENPNNNDIRDALIQLRQELGQQIKEVTDKVDQLGDKVNQLDSKVNQLDNTVNQLDYKFDAYQKGTDGMVRMANTIIIATASVVILAGFSPAVNAIITSLFAVNQQ
ncbi:MAG: hypothetical protein NW224_01615 [Leptolyngbyaceae cyanobacterium bins.302]|nr:hypothetical protein [Leptolyngbyaceae cyanobacterium bins.302]